MIIDPRVRLPFRHLLLFIHGIAAHPVHDNFLLTQQMGCPKELSLRNTASNLICHVARVQFVSHCRQAANALVRVVSKLPPISRHKLGEHLPEIDQSVNQHSPDGRPSRCEQKHLIYWDSVIDLRLRRYEPWTASSFSGAGPGERIISSQRRRSSLRTFAGA